MANLLKDKGVQGILVGSAVVEGARLALRKYGPVTWDEQTRDWVATFIGVALGGALYYGKKRELGKYVAVSAAATQIPNLVNRVAGQLQGFAGVVSADRVSSGVLDVMAGVVEAEPAQLPAYNISGANVGTSFGSVPVAGVH